MASVPNQGAWQGDFEDGGTNAPDQGAWQSSSEPAPVGEGIPVMSVENNIYHVDKNVFVNN